MERSSNTSSLMERLDGQIAKHIFVLLHLNGITGLFGIICFAEVNISVTVFTSAAESNMVNMLCC